MRGRLVILGAAAVLTAAALLFGGAFRGGARPTADDAAAAPNTLAAAAATSPAGGLGGDTPVGGTTGQQVQQLQDRLRANPRDAHSYALLGLAYQQRARETGDPAYYTKSGGALRRALRLAPNDLIATGGLGSLALSRHRFREALALGRRRSRASPTTRPQVRRDRRRPRRARPLRASVPRLRHDGADSGRASPPTRASRTRASCSADPPDAIAGDADSRSTRPAANSPSRPPGRASSSASSTGRPGGSTARSRSTAAALAAFPGYAYALDALAHVEAARGHTQRAIALETRAVDAIPLPQFVGLPRRPLRSARAARSRGGSTR